MIWNFWIRIQEKVLLKKSVSIIIAAEHTVTDDDRYFHKYSMRDEKDNSQFTDLLEIDILELKKLPKADDGTDLWDWLRFIKTNNEEEMEMLAQTNPEIEKAYDALQDLSNDEVLRHEAQQHEMYLQNELAINEENYERGMKEKSVSIAKNLLNINLPLEQIAVATGLSIDEIKNLKSN